jgi:hypothetical protein
LSLRISQTLPAIAEIAQDTDFIVH